MEVNNQYKLTDVGVIPEDWDLKKIGKITDSTAGGTPNTLIDEYWGGEIKWMSSGELHQKRVFEVEGRITEKGLINSSAKLIPINSILIGLAGQGKTRGTVAINKIALCTNQSIAAILPTEHIFPEYLFYNMDSRYDELRQLSSGEGGRGGLNLSIINALYIPLPPLPEQQAIAEALSDVDALIEALEQLLAKKRQIKQGAMQELLTGKRRLPGFSEEWKDKSLGEIAEIVMGQSPSSVYYNNDRNGLPLIQGNADIINRQTIKRVFTSKVTKLGRNGDIIMSVRAPVGKVSRAIFDVCLGRGVCAIRFPNNYLFHYLIFKEFAWANLSKGSTFDAVNSSDVKAFPMEIPGNKTEQIAIAEILSDMDSEIIILEEKLSKAHLIKQGMMQELLTGRIRLI